MRDDESFTLYIASGLHAGASCTLPDRPLTIGADFSADVVLHDEGIAPIHLVLEPNGSDLRIIVRAPGVIIENTKVEQDETVLSAMPVSFLVGAVAFQCEGVVVKTIVTTGDPHDKIIVRSLTALLPRTLQGRAVGAGLLGMLVFGVIALRVVASGGTPAHAASSVLLSHEDRTTAVSGPAELRLRTGEELNALGLQGVSLSINSGIVTTTGHIAPADAAKLHALELWFDRRFGGSAILLSQVDVASPETLSIQLQSVWNGPRPNIVVAGQCYAEGSTLPDGSVVKKIMARAILFLRHGQPYSLEY